MRYGGKYPQVDRVIYTNGEEDPWKWASVLPGDKTRGREVYPIEIQCTNCAHCVDLKAPSEDPENPDDPALTAAREQIIEIIGGWIQAETTAELQMIPIHNREGFVKQLLAQ